MNELLSDGWDPGAPSCFNRPARAEAYVRHVLNQQTGQMERQEHPRWYEDVCKTHDGSGIGPKGENYPTAHGWLPYCKKCQHNPKPAAWYLDVEEAA